MMMEAGLIFLLSYFSIIFLAKDKISKSVGLLISHIGPKQRWPIRLQHFKSNISLEQSNARSLNLRVDKKKLLWVWSEMVVATLLTR